MSEELVLPTVPEAKPEDSEDVSWALSTADAMWARGDHLEGIKWVRRAAEAASEAENDTRALELAKAAADLTALLTRKSRASVADVEEVEPEPPSESVPISIAEPSHAAPRPPPPPRPIAGPGGAVGKPAPPKPAPAAGKPPPASIRPPAPLPSRTSQPPRAKPASLRPGAKGKGRKSRENLDAEARKAFEDKTVPAAIGVADTDETATTNVEMPAKEQLTNATSITAAPRVQIGPNDPTFVGHINDFAPNKGEKSAADWDAAATMNLTGEDLPLFNEGDRKTVVGAAPSPNFKATMQSAPRENKSSGPPATTAAAPIPPPTPINPAAPPAGARPSVVDRHDPGIRTSQAVRVVVWRDSGGVHVAPAGTMVSAITVDAMLVALEPNADLTAWLSEKTSR